MKPRSFTTIATTSTEELDKLVNDFAAKQFIINVDAHCYNNVWYAFILHEPL